MINIQLLWCILAFSINKVYAQCNRIVTRPEIRSLSPEQRTSYFNAVKRLHSGRDQFSSFSQDHFGNVPSAHGVPAFFPWHRFFIRAYERSLQAIDPSVVLPYWDWSQDSQAPEDSEVLSDDFFGGNGRSSDRCVVTGTFANWQARIPNRHCLRRRYNSGSSITSFYSTEALEAIISQSRNFDSLRTRIEGGPHGAVHTGVGGNGGDFTTMYSTNDPLFYAHHAFVDLIWSEWQARNPSLANTYNGGSARPTDNMRPFNVQVRSVFKTTDLCYTYPRFGTSLPNMLMRRDYNTKTNLKDYVKDICDRAPGLHKVDPNDRQIHNKLRVPKPLPEEYITSNNMEVTRVRNDEALIANLTMALNTIPGFVPAFSI